MLDYPIEPCLLCLVRTIIYFHRLSVPAVKALVRLCIYTGLSELSLYTAGLWDKYQNLMGWLIMGLFKRRPVFVVADRERLSPACLAI